MRRGVVLNLKIPIIYISCGKGLIPVPHSRIDEWHSDSGDHASDHLNFLSFRMFKQNHMVLINTHHIGGEVHLQCILHIIDGDIGSGLWRETGVK